MSSAPVRVDVWSDFVCPFCLIAALRLQRLAGERPLDVNWHAFLLHPPGAPPMDEAKRAMIERHQPVLRAQLLDEFDLELARGPLGVDTVPAHRAARLAEREGLGNALTDRLLRAYWLEAADLSDAATLRRLAREAGVQGDPLAADADLDQRVGEDLAFAERHGFRSVPTLVFGQRLLVSGAQPYEVFAGAADEAARTAG